MIYGVTYNRESLLELRDSLTAILATDRPMLEFKADELYGDGILEIEIDGRKIDL